MLKKIFIVRGHGKNSNGQIDNGAQGNGTDEWTEAGQVCEELISILGRDNEFSIMGIGIINRMTLAEKIQEINSECKASKISANESIIIDIHFNSSINISANGIEAWYSAKKTGARDFANTLVKSVSAYTNLPVRRKPTNSSKENRLGRLAIIDDTIPAGCLIELGFISNNFDAEFIKNAQLDDKFAIGLRAGIRSWQGLSKQEPKPILPDFYYDVPESEWYYEAVKYCLEQGIFTMNKEGLFSPDRPA